MREIVLLNYLTHNYLQKVSLVLFNLQECISVNNALGKL